MNKTILGCSLALISPLLIENGTAFAATVTLGGETFEVTTVVGTFAELQDTLSEQPWAGVDLGLASDAANQVGNSLGLPNTTFENFFGQPLNQSFAPIFASGTVAQGLIAGGIVNGAVFEKFQQNEESIVCRANVKRNTHSRSELTQK